MAIFWVATSCLTCVMGWLVRLRCVRLERYGCRSWKYGCLLSILAMGLVLWEVMSCRLGWYVCWLIGLEFSTWAFILISYFRSRHVYGQGMSCSSCIALQFVQVPFFVFETQARCACDACGLSDGPSRSFFRLPQDRRFPVFQKGRVQTFRGQEPGFLGRREILED